MKSFTRVLVSRGCENGQIKNLTGQIPERTRNVNTMNKSKSILHISHRNLWTNRQQTNVLINRQICVEYIQKRQISCQDLWTNYEQAKSWLREEFLIYLLFPAKIIFLCQEMFSIKGHLRMRT